MFRFRRWMIPIGLILALAACGSTAPPAATTEPTAIQRTETVAPSATSEAPAPSAATSSATPAATATPTVRALPTPTAAPPLNTGEAPPDLVQMMIADLAGRLNINPGTISVQSAEAVVWSDSSLGCPMPDVMYMQVLMDGYKVVLVADTVPYDYHAAVDGRFVLCEQAGE